MPLRWGPGPVFVHESIAATRRWQLYALRSFLCSVCWPRWHSSGCSVCLERRPSRRLDLDQRACRGRASTSFTRSQPPSSWWCLLVAPAATAGAICLDRARGTLTHMLVTELADTEIVLGKLAARLLPVVALVAATIPVLALSGLLGGVIFEAILSLTLITLALALFGCTLALAFSVRATKTHEV